MSEMLSIAAAGAVAPLTATSAFTSAPTSPASPAVGFGEFLSRAFQQVEAKINIANDKVRAFALDDSIPIHEVTIALAEARLAIELAAQVRMRLVEGYREIMNMQL